MKKTKASDYEKFVGLVDKVLSVPHHVVKAKLDAEKVAKKRKKLKVSGASREEV